MSDEQPIPVSIRFVQQVVLVVDEWPALTSFSEEWLERYAHVNHAMVEGDTVTFKIGNGIAAYQLRRDLPRYGDGIVAELVSGDTPTKLKAAAKKFERVP